MNTRGDMEQAATSSLRTLRNIIDAGLKTVGAAVILGATINSGGPQEITFVLFGLLLIIVGSLKPARKYIRNERAYFALRDEANEFLMLTRQLNRAAVSMAKNSSPEHRQEFEQLKEKMHNAVNRMAVVAGKTNTDLGTDSEFAWKNEFFGPPPGAETKPVVSTGNGHYSEES